MSKTPAAKRLDALFAEAVRITEKPAALRAEIATLERERAQLETRADVADDDTLARLAKLGAALSAKRRQLDTLDVQGEVFRLKNSKEGEAVLRALVDALRAELRRFEAERQKACVTVLSNAAKADVNALRVEDFYCAADTANDFWVDVVNCRNAISCGEGLAGQVSIATPASAWNFDTALAQLAPARSALGI
ncbi:MAG: hypothetical protein WCL04_06740 [Verrucomicrobiota bacterium]